PGEVERQGSSARPGLERFGSHPAQRGQKEARGRVGIGGRGTGVRTAVQILPEVGRLGRERRGEQHEGERAQGDGPGTAAWMRHPACPPLRATAKEPGGATTSRPTGKRAAADAIVTGW